MDSQFLKINGLQRMIWAGTSSGTFSYRIFYHFLVRDLDLFDNKSRAHLAGENNQLRATENDVDCIFYRKFLRYI